MPRLASGSQRLAALAAAMCGIFGTYSYQVPRTRREILECLLTGLRRLEYRGYDSAGVCLDGPATPGRAADGAAAAAAEHGDGAAASPGAPLQLLRGMRAAV